MKKFGLLLVAVLLVVSSVYSGSTAENVGIDIVTIYTDNGPSSGQALDSSSADTAYFRLRNPKVDSLIVFFENSATTGNPEVTMKIETTVDDIGLRFQGTNQYDLTKARDAQWNVMGTVFTDLTTESTLLYYGISDSIAMSNPGVWGRIICSTDGDHDPAGYILHEGVLWVPKAR